MTHWEPSERVTDEMIGCELCAIILVEVESDEHYERLADLCENYHESGRRRQDRLELLGPGLMTALEALADENFTALLRWCHDDPSLLPKLDEQLVWPPKFLDGIVTTVRERKLDTSTTRALLRFAYVINFEQLHRDGHPDWRQVLVELAEMTPEQIQRGGDLAQALLDDERHLSESTTPLTWIQQILAGLPLEQILTATDERAKRTLDAPELLD